MNADHWLDVYNPFFDDLIWNGMETFLNHTTKFEYPFFYVLSAKWARAQQMDECGFSRTISRIDIESRNTLIMPDHFLSWFTRTHPNTNLLDRYKGKLILFTCAPEPGSGANRATCAMNPFVSAREGHLDERNAYGYHQHPLGDEDSLPIVPMGCGSSWIGDVKHTDKTIFLDEPHMTVIDKLDDPDDIRSRMFTHALSTCRVLSAMGFRIVTFSRTSSAKLDAIYRDNPHIEVVGCNGWIPYATLLEHYSSASIFYSHFPESFGYPIYENMQIGNGIAIYAESFDAYRLRHMQKGVSLSVFSSPETCAKIISEYYSRYVAHRLRSQIAAEANEAYSVDTFFRRLRSNSQFQLLCSSS